MSQIYDLIVVGGGPAGITAGIYAARKKLKTLLIARDFFGQLSKAGYIENWPGVIGNSGMDLMKALEHHLKQFPIEIKTGEKVVEVSRKAHRFYCVQTETNQQFSARAIIIAAGREPKKLGIKGEEEFIGKGVSFCSICDAPFFTNKQVAVVGGGNAGLETALDLAKYAKKIFIFENSPSLKADEILQEGVKNEKKIEIFLQKEIEEIIGDKTVQAIKFKDLENNKTLQMPMAGVFVEVGMRPVKDFTKGLIELSADGEIIIDPKTCQTSVEGIFAAGDVVNGKWKQAIIAAGEGAKAALAVYDYLRNNF